MAEEKERIATLKTFHKDYSEKLQKLAQNAKKIMDSTDELSTLAVETLQSIVLAMEEGAGMLIGGHEVSAKNLEADDKSIAKMQLSIIEELLAEFDLT